MTEIFSELATELEHSTTAEQVIPLMYKMNGGFLARPQSIFLHTGQIRPFSVLKQDAETMLRQILKNVPSSDQFPITLLRLNAETVRSRQSPEVLVRGGGGGGKDTILSSCSLKWKSRNWKYPSTVEEARAILMKARIYHSVIYFRSDGQPRTSVEDIICVSQQY